MAGRPPIDCAVKMTVLAVLPIPASWSGKRQRMAAAQHILPAKLPDLSNIFVVAHGDMFHENVPDEWIDRVFAVMALAPRHRFQILTKRADRMLAYTTDRSTARSDGRGEAARALGYDGPLEFLGSIWPLPNVWMMTSAEDQKRADERIPDLLKTPAAVRGVSLEPLLGPIDIRDYLPAPAPLNLASTYVDGDDVERLDLTGERIVGLDWVIVGGESGPNARPMHHEWPLSLRDQCVAAGVPFFFKQFGEWAPRPVERTAKPAPGSIVGKKWLYAKRRHGFDDGTGAYLVGKTLAGRELDGREWNEMPGEANA